ncbi:MAG: prepilin-type N-terminal cleavage/methylation domain-containing protein, partial [bacterium]
MGRQRQRTRAGVRHRGGAVTPRRAFTLVELLVSITVLLIILGAVARIFSTASK